MNTDRFLTRIWDTEEKRMIYLGDKINFPKFIDLRFRFVTNEFVGASQFMETEYYLEPFGTRFIPMQCLGDSDKNNKLIYQHDIVRCSNPKKKKNDVIIEIDYNIKQYGWVGLFSEDTRDIDNRWNLQVFKLGIPMGESCLNKNYYIFEILGNKFEHPELKKQMTNYNDYNVKKWAREMNLR